MVIKLNKNKQMKQHLNFDWEFLTSCKGDCAVRSQATFYANICRLLKKITLKS
jgi:hypothetical protein